MATVKITQSNFQEEVAESDIPVVVDFWAAWCRPCRIENPNLVRLYKKYNFN